MSADGLSAADVVAVTCDTLEEGRTLALDVGDEVIVARITQRQTGDVTCPIEGCVRRFDSQKGLSTHLGKIHPEYDRRPECAECGERYDPSHTDQIYCSLECYHESGRTTLECEYCGEVFPIKESHVDSRRHCSQECYLAHKQDGDSTKEERVCEASGCDEVFEVYPSQEKQYCSRQCAGQGRRERETRSCAFCARDFEVRTTDDKRYCCRPCFHEDCRDDRPQSLYGRVRGVIDENYSRESTFHRLRGHLGPEYGDFEAILAWSLYTTDTYEEAVQQVTDILDEGIDNHELWPAAVRVSRHVCSVDSRADSGTILTTLDESRTWFEVTQELRISRNQARKLYRYLGVDQEVEQKGYLQDIFDEVREGPQADNERSSGSEAEQPAEDPLEQYRVEVSL